MSSTKSQGKSSLSRMNRREAVTGWLMAGPVIILIFMFLIVPFLMAFGLSFTNQRLVSPNPTEWVGMRNFKRLMTVKTLTMDPLVDEKSGAFLTDETGNIAYPRLREFTRNPDYPQYTGMRELFSYNRGDSKIIVLASDVIFLKALLNTLKFVFIVVPCQGGLALLLALLLNRKLKGINLFRTLFFMPVIVSMVVVALLWKFIYDGQNGLLNTLLSGLTFGSFQPVDWIGKPATALPAIIIMSIWQAVGFHMVIWLAGLQNIPIVRYEASSIDGAGIFQQFRYVTWPGLRNTAVFVFVVITMQAFAVFTQINAMTKGGPLDSTQTVIFQAVERGYGKQDIAGGSAISVIFFMLVLMVSILQRVLTREKEG
ncbi:MAG: sugar ABC transporter permease [Spirochaetales bacterium]|nr:sugar ABC transporter permease [Spirochaetales bacterium]